MAMSSQCHKTILSQALAAHSQKKRRVARAAHASAPVDGGKQQRHAASAKDLKIALGIDTKEKQELPLWSLLMDKLQETADYITETTETDTYQERSLQFVMLAFPIWLLYLLVASGAIQLPF